MHIKTGGGFGRNFNFAESTPIFSKRDLLNIFNNVFERDRKNGFNNYFASERNYAIWTIVELGFEWECVVKNLGKQPAKQAGEDRANAAFITKDELLKGFYDLVSADKAGKEVTISAEFTREWLRSLRFNAEEVEGEILKVRKSNQKANALRTVLMSPILLVKLVGMAAVSPLAVFSKGDNIADFSKKGNVSKFFAMALSCAGMVVGIPLALKLFWNPTDAIEFQNFSYALGKSHPTTENIISKIMDFKGPMEENKVIISSDGFAELKKTAYVKSVLTEMKIYDSKRRELGALTFHDIYPVQQISQGDSIMLELANPSASDSQLAFSFSTMSRIPRDQEYAFRKQQILNDIELHLKALY